MKPNNLVKFVQTMPWLEVRFQENTHINGSICQMHNENIYCKYCWQLKTNNK